jgi:predicted nucleic-acid-binding protein
LKGLDSNVLLRYLVEDDPVQSRQAAKVMDDAARREEPLFLSLLVLCEVAWVLDRSYDQPRVVIASILDAVLNTDAFAVERDELARGCIAQFRAGKAGFADYVIGAVARDLGCEATFSFDRDLRGVAGFLVL